MLRNSEITKTAYAALKGNWVNPILAGLLYLLLSGLPQWIAPVFGLLIYFLIIGVLEIGLRKFFLESCRRKQVEIELLFSEFKRFGVALVAVILTGLIICAGFLLLIIPAFIWALSLSQVFYILAENPTISAMDAIKLSFKMMKGKKWKLFCLQLRFIGWIFLGILTLGIGLLWVLPYLQMSNAIFYLEAKAAYFGTTEQFFSDPLA